MLSVVSMLYSAINIHEPRPTIGNLRLPRNLLFVKLHTATRVKYVPTSLETVYGFHIAMKCMSV